MPVETVTSILAGIRDEIVDLVVVKKQNAQLNMAFGTLNLRAGGTVEFKSNNCGSGGQLAIETDYDKIATMSPEAGERISMSGDKKSNGSNVFYQKR